MTAATVDMCLYIVITKALDKIDMLNKLIIKKRGGAVGFWV